MHAYHYNIVSTLRIVLLIHRISFYGNQGTVVLVSGLVYSW